MPTHTAMTDVPPEGGRYWQASDGKWYPPHLHPDSPAQNVALLPPATPEGTRRGSGCREAFWIILVILLFAFVIFIGLAMAGALDLRSRLESGGGDASGRDAVASHVGAVPAPAVAA